MRDAPSSGDGPAELFVSPGHDSGPANVGRMVISVAWPTSAPNGGRTRANPTLTATSAGQPPAGIIQGLD
jgi:hypothetical protein